MRVELVWTAGIVVRGHGVASGRGGDPRFPEGTIRLQLEAFRRMVPNFEARLGGLPFPGTINLRLPGVTTHGDPECRTGPILWTDVFPPEDFLLSTCLIEHRRIRWPALIYTPDPATKADHHQPGNVIELLAAHVPGLRYGDTVLIGRAEGVLSIAPT